jgi:hypothetical protein
MPPMEPSARVEAPSNVKHAAMRQLQQPRHVYERLDRVFIHCETVAWRVQSLTCVGDEEREVDFPKQHLAPWGVKWVPASPALHCACTHKLCKDLLRCALYCF